MTVTMTTERSLLDEFVRAYPFQPATALWRAVEVAHVLEFPFPTGRGLDLGCGDGKLTAIVAARVGPRDWTGVDLDAQEVEAARGTGLYRTLHVAPASAIPEPDASFDFVFSNSVLEHLEDLPGTLREVGRLLKPGGSFLFTVPSETFHACLHGPLLPVTRRSAYLRALDARLAHRRYLSPSGWALQLREHGLEIERESRFLTEPQVRRWEAISRVTAGVLHAAHRGRKHPLEIQRSLGLRRPEWRTPRALATPIATALAARDVLDDRSPLTGGLMILARKQ